MNHTLHGIASHIGATALARLYRVRVGIAGCGGLGSNCAMHLVRSGFASLVLCDHDSVEASNLNRQFFFARQIGQPKTHALAENLRAINPELHLRLEHRALAPHTAAEVFADCDAVVECLDDAAAKAMLAETLLPRGVFYVGASGIAGCGDNDAIVIRTVRPDLHIVGDGGDEAGPDAPPLSPGVGIAAAKQAGLVLAHFLKEHA
jgi:sulfur carrier protein ThiS adenylyltransferase